MLMGGLCFKRVSSVRLYFLFLFDLLISYFDMRISNIVCSFEIFVLALASWGVKVIDLPF